MIAIDTNLLVYAHRSGLAEHECSKAALEKAAANPGGWAIPWPCVAEFWAVVTHEANQRRPSHPDEAAEYLGALIEAGAKILPPRPGMLERLLRLAAENDILGARIFDLQIALTAYEAGAAEIWPHDKRFVSHPELPVRDPLPG